MYNLLEYSKNYKKTTGSLWNYYRDEPNLQQKNGILLIVNQMVIICNIIQ